MDTELLSLRELARRTGASLHEVRRWRDSEGLRVYQTGRRRQSVLWSDFCNWLTERAVVEGQRIAERRCAIKVTQSS